MHMKTVVLSAADVPGGFFDIMEEKVAWDISRTGSAKEILYIYVELHLGEKKNLERM